MRDLDAPPPEPPPDMVPVGLDDLALEDIITIQANLSDLFDLDDATLGGSGSKYLQEKSWHVGLLPGDADLTDVSIWFTDKADGLIQGDSTA